MKIKSIKATKLKGRGIDLVPHGVNIISGKNFRGKTAIMDAIKVGLYGVHPKLKKQKTIKLSSGGEMTVDLEFENGEHAQHAWWKEGRTQKSDQSFPQDFTVPNVMLDFNSFLSLSGPAQVEYVFGQINLTAIGFTDEKVIETVKADCQPETTTEESDKAIKEIVDKITELAVARDQESVSTQDWLSTVVEEIKKKRDSASTVVDQMTGTSQGMTQLGAQSTQAPPRALPIIQGELKKMREEKAQLDQVIGGINSKVEAYNKNRSRVGELNSKIIGYLDPSSKIEEHETTIKRLESIVAEKKETLTERETKAAAYQSHTQKYAQAVSDADYAYKDNNKNIEAWKRTLAALEKERDEMLSKDCCPVCRSKKAWKESYTAHMQGRIDQWQSKITEAESQTQTLFKTLGDAIALHTVSKQDDAANDAARRAVAQLRGELEQHRSELDVTKKHISNLKESSSTLEKWKAERNGLDASVEMPPSQDDLNETNRKLQEIGANITALETEQRRATSAATDALRVAQAAKQRAKSQAELEVCKLAIKSLQKLQSQFSDKAIESLMGTARKFTTDLLETPLEYNAKEGEFGRWSGEQWISIDTFSGCEEAIAFAGLSVALSQNATCKIVLIDELGKVDDDKINPLIQRMIELEQAGVIDHFFGIDVGMFRYASTGVNMIRLD